MLTKRIISSAVLIIIIIVAIRIDWLVSLITAAFIVMGLYEFFTMLEHKGISIYKYVGLGLGALIPLSIIYRFEPTKGWELFFIILALVFLIMMQFTRRQNSGAVVGISTTIFGILYISWFMSFLIKVRYMQGGVGLLSAVLLITKSGDIGAYLVGSRFGKTPLIPRISPNKTIEGAVAGLLFSISAALSCKWFVNLNYVHLLFIGVSLAVLGQLGDLSESMMKRDCGIKDSGSIFPGLGGVLDSIDSLIFTAPAFYFYMSVILK
ncbi:MAG: phosphatidate cytidylyltransferase [Candidatus Omnitrophica bacterium]|nr:phosphatidate cytidylyltransferase [Candidatus Omnitrophota bacterium]